MSFLQLVALMTFVWNTLLKVVRWLYDDARKLILDGFQKPLVVSYCWLYCNGAFLLSYVLVVGRVCARFVNLCVLQLRWFQQWQTWKVKKLLRHHFWVRQKKLCRREYVMMSWYLSKGMICKRVLLCVAVLSAVFFEFYPFLCEMHSSCQNERNFCWYSGIQNQILSEA